MSYEGLSKKQVIKGLECLTQRQEPTANPCKECGYINRPNFAICVKDIASDALELLKEQEAVKPVQDKKTGRVWLCGNCGSYVGFEDHDEDDPNEFDKFCRECGHPVSWEGR